MLLGLLLGPEILTATGIEKNTDMCNVFRSWCHNISEDDRMNTFARAMPDGTRMIGGDATKDEAALSAIKEADVIFMNNALFDTDQNDRRGSLNGRLLLLLEAAGPTMNSGCCVITTKPLTAKKGAFIIIVIIL